MIKEPIGAALNRDIAKGEHVEEELEQFISRQERDRLRIEGERVQEEAWRTSERRRDAAREARLKQEWWEYHIDQAGRIRANLEALVAHHEAEAEKYLLQKGA